MNWFAEQRKRLDAEFSSGKITEKKYKEKIDALDELCIKITNKPKKISSGIIGLIIILVLTSFSCYYIINNAFETNVKLTVSAVAEGLLDAQDSDFNELSQESSSQHNSNANKNEANANERDKGMTPLVLTENNYGLEAIRALIKAWVDDYGANTKGQAKPLFAIKNPYSEALAAFKKEVENLDEKDALDEVSLLLAIKNHFDPKVVTALINTGAIVGVDNYSDFVAKVNARRNNVNTYEGQSMLRKGLAIKNIRKEPAMDVAIKELAMNAARKELAINGIKKEPAMDVDRKELAINGIRKEPDMSVVIKGLAMDAARKELAMNDIRKVLAMNGIRIEPAMNVNRFIDFFLKGSLEQISEAIKNGANLNERDRAGMTPLMAAAGFNNPEVVAMLLKAGANIKDRDDFGRTAEDYARMNGRLDNLKALGVTNKDRRFRRIQNNSQFQTQSKLSQSSDGANKDYANKIVELTNAERREAGLATLSVNLDLTAAANQRARELELWYSHTRPDGRPSNSILSDYNIIFTVAGENISARFDKTPTDKVNEWMNSPGHRANILTHRYTHIGVGVYITERDVYAVQLFARIPDSDSLKKNTQKGLIDPVIPIR